MKLSIKGIKGKDFVIDTEDSLGIKLAMLFEGHCTIGVLESIKKYGYTEQRYYQLLSKFAEGGSQALVDKKTGSDKQPDGSGQAIRPLKNKSSTYERHVVSL